jgi:hypothetical protein
LTMVLNSVQPVISGMLLRLTSWWFCFVHVTSTSIVELMALICWWFRGCHWRRMARPCCIHQPRLLLRFRVTLGLPSRLQVQLRSYGNWLC